MARKRMISVMFVLILVLLIAGLIYAENKHNYKPKEGYVPDEKTAIRIAVAVWIPIYGEKKIDGEKPYHAKLENGIWTIEGTLPKNMLGGVAVAEIAKDDGRIIGISHGK